VNAVQKFTTVTGKAAPLMKANIDTDVIIPAKCLVGHQRNQLGAFAFDAYRYRPDRTDNPDFVLNQPRYRGAQVLITGENFGCGSSRESAVWALAGIGMRCVIAPGFGDIFFNNAFQNGMLLVRLPKEQVERLAAELESEATPTVTVDLQKQIIASPSGRQIPFEVDAERRQALLEGRDQIGMTLTRDADIRAFQERDRDTRPWIYQTVPRTAPAA
jgi:3-isopropylmalate/(R)-2-methylmalate dehydratase small subunit